jgi:hypothetical protein
VAGCVNLVIRTDPDAGSVRIRRSRTTPARCDHSGMRATAELAPGALLSLMLICDCGEPHVVPVVLCWAEPTDDPDAAPCDLIGNGIVADANAIKDANLGNDVLLLRTPDGLGLWVRLWLE